MVTINGTVSHFHLRFYCVSCKCRQPFSLNQTSPVELICKSCWHSALQSVPYTTHFRMLVFTGSRKPVFYRNQMGHVHAQMVYEIYATWIEEMNTKLTL
ncbi:lambdoid prophage Rac integrase [Enterobacter hormaechei]|nr:lambdoid prophage Rac integrase [Enterobacter hormaechei]SAB56456.1 lambdoid prophage Rac integrase [Enterobacter hormaechei]SAC07587.1 lambdoid prophage Rac integrase [Enterobacter hormaechei]SAD47168.1 lambdoid prophage Rac integrase [Enterobacter hormaechei]VAF86835.1 lambdoid prophage Rac integrase [Enterobacter hormaechei]